MTLLFGSSMSATYMYPLTLESLIMSWLSLIDAEVMASNEFTIEADGVIFSYIDEELDEVGA